MNLKIPSGEALRRKIESDPDDEPTAGNVPTVEDQLASALLDMMNAYERRVRTDCKTQEELDKRPWECAEYRAAADLLKTLHSAESR